MFSPIRVPVEDGKRFPIVRGTDVTASVVGALFGVNQYVSEWMLWQKHANGERFPEAGLLARMGTVLEPAVAQLLEEEENMVLEKETGYWREPNARIGAMLDYWCYKWGDKHYEDGIPLDVKCVSSRGWSGKWKNGKTVPLQHVLQIQVQCALTQRPTGLLGCMVAAESLHVFEVPFSQPLFDELLARLADFWRRVHERVEPSPDMASDAEMILRKYRKVAEGKHVDLSNDNEAHELCRQYMNASEELTRLGSVSREVEKQKQNARAALFFKMKDAETATVGPLSITTKETSRKGFVVQPSTSRSISIKE